MKRRGEGERPPSREAWVQGRTMMVRWALMTSSWLVKRSLSMPPCWASTTTAPRPESTVASPVAAPSTCTPAAPQLIFLFLLRFLFFVICFAYLFFVADLADSSCASVTLDGLAETGLALAKCT